VANDQERAALQGQMSALQQHMEETHRNLPNLPARPVKHYIMQAMVFEDCVGLPPPTEPEEPTEPVDASVSARLDRIEAQLKRILAKLEA
jgi:hypothetical protein